MEIKEEHKPLLKDLGLSESDFERFDGRFVRYEYDEKMGVRIYDPYYRTSYEEYIDSDGWSAWSSEGDTFMSSILKTSRDTARKIQTPGSGSDREKITQALQKKFGKAVKTDTEPS